MAATNASIAVFQEPEPSSSDYIQIFYLLLLFCIGAPLNVLAFWKLFRQYLSTDSRIVLLSLHLNVSDLLILFFYALAKVCWLITYQWIGGSALCKIVKFVQSTGFTLSSNVIICIALDRTVSLLYPLRVKTEARARCKRSLIWAWAGAILCNLPQLYTWTVYDASPKWSQCVDVWTIWEQEQRQHPNRTDDVEIATLMKTGYHAFHLVTVFWLPLGVVITCYAIIAQIVYRNLNNLEHDCLINKRISDAGLISTSYQSLISNNNDNNNRNGGPVLLSVNQRRRSSVAAITCDSRRVSLAALPAENNLRRNVSGRGRIKRMKLKTLKITFGIVLLYIICWLPYNVATLMRWLHLPSYSLIAKYVYSLHGLIVANAVINPFMYSNLSIFKRKKTKSTPRIIIEQC